MEEFERNLQVNLIKNIKIYHFLRAVLTQKKLANWSNVIACFVMSIYHEHYKVVDAVEFKIFENEKKSK